MAHGPSPVIRPYQHHPCSPPHTHLQQSRQLDSAQHPRDGQLVAEQRRKEVFQAGAAQHSAAEEGGEGGLGDLQREQGRAGREETGK